MEQADVTEQRIYQTEGEPSGAPLRTALIGAGTVGAATLELLRRHPQFHVMGALVRNARQPRDFHGWEGVVTDDPELLSTAELVIEVAGGTGVAADLALAHLARGGRLVTANKAALAERWDEFLPHMREGRLYYEAAVMAGTPAIGVVAGALRGSAPSSLHAVLNGTCNVILAAMDEGVEYGAALAEAQRLGYAEADPTLDVEGVDAAHKLTVLARLAFDPHLSWFEVRDATTGITRLSASDLAAEAERGRRVRLIGSVTPAGGAWHARVRPVSLPLGHPLLTAGAANALLFSGDPVGEVVVRGRGAGGGSTASGVMSDALAAAAGVSGPLPLSATQLPPSGAAGEGGAAAEIEEL